MTGFPGFNIHHDSYYSLLHFKDGITVSRIAPKNYTTRYDGMHNRKLDHS